MFCSKYLHDGNFLTQEESLEAVRLIEGYSSVLEKFKTHYFFYSKSHDYLATIMQRDYLFFEAELSLFSERLARLHQKIICKEPIARQDFGLSLLNAYLLDTKELMFGFMRSEFKLIAEQYPQLDRVALYGWGLAFVMVNYFDLLSTRHYEEQTQGYDLLSFVDSFLQHKINYDCHDDHAGTSLTEYAAHYEGAQLRAHADMHSEKKIFSLENVFAQLQPLLRYRYILDACFRLDSPYSQISAQTESAQLCQNYKELMINTYAFLDRWLSKDFTDNNSFLHIRNLMGRLRLLLDNDITLLKALLHKQSDQ